MQQQHLLLWRPLLQEQVQTAQKCLQKEGRQKQGMVTLMMMTIMRREREGTCRVHRMAAVGRRGLQRQQLLRLRLRWRWQ
jgi:hypothetical protein